MILKCEMCGNEFDTCGKGAAGAKLMLDDGSSITACQTCIEKACNHHEYLNEFLDRREKQMEIKDSGERREFESGAVRDIAEGKGRCDLLPLDCVAEYFSQFNCPKYTFFYRAEAVSEILYELNEVQFYSTNCPAKNHIMTAIETFIRIAYEDKFGHAFMELSKHYEEGAKKYSERNWQKGIPAHCYIDSCVRHLLKWYDRWDDEPHDRAVLWNLFGLMWTLEHKPELNDMPCNKKEGDGE